MLEYAQTFLIRLIEERRHLGGSRITTVARMLECGVAPPQHTCLHVWALLVAGRRFPEVVPGRRSGAPFALPGTRADQVTWPRVTQKQQLLDTDVIVFVDADTSHEATYLPKLAQPGFQGYADLCAGSGFSGGWHELLVNGGHSFARWEHIHEYCNRPASAPGIACHERVAIYVRQTGGGRPHQLLERNPRRQQ